MRAAAALPVLSALLCAPAAYGHTSVVCSSTSETTPNEFVFYICTYHGNPCSNDANPGGAGPTCNPDDPIPGRVSLQLGSRDPEEFEFSSWCSLQN
eukprot:gene16172-66117_t